VKTEHVVGKLSDVPEGKHIVVKAGGREIGVYNVRGKFHAIPNNCFHQNGPLCLGATTGTVVANEQTGWKRVWQHDGEIAVCPWHGFEFNVTTGQCLAYPNRRIPTYEVKVENDQIKVVF
jgi:3-phenylpropionate/trans-cinnamate dioxygenase ferredoxin subunit